MKKSASALAVALFFSLKNNKKPNFCFHFFEKKRLNSLTNMKIELNI